MFFIIGKPLFRFLLFVLFLFSVRFSIAQEASIEKGIIDLRNVGLQKRPVALNGNWGFYWNQLLSPDEIKTVPEAYTYFPERWDNTMLNGKKLPAKGFATYSLKILLDPEKQKDLAIQLPDTYCSFQLFLNGKPFAAAGKPGKTKEETVEKWIEQVINLPVTDTVSLVLQVANFRHSKGGPYKPVVIGDAALLQAEKSAEEGFDLLLAGAILMGGLFFIGLFYFGKHDKVILYFSLFCIAYCYWIHTIRFL